ncbi:hypothetical protein PPROV_000598200 [Pycnococcus provasolii]|uniref:Protein CLP1 homolog n=1 Tax=Pycnococcus provasolii TaxID=41880 RepID=A0A830HP61_9CHLO|nr:hypothetical protein PPROV_000598200 [Pycnococcus provasolii]
MAPSSDAAADGEPSGDVMTYHLKAEHELRIEVDFDRQVTVKLLSGDAEIFGCELPKGGAKTLSGVKCAIFTWHAAQIQIVGKPDACYEAEASAAMRSYLNLHTALEERRKAAVTTTSPTTKGPRVLVVGNTDAGKSTVCKILCSYACRADAMHGGVAAAAGHDHWVPVFVDLDVGQNSVTPPGTICAVPVDAPVDPVDGWPGEAPLVYYFGHASPGENAAHYKALVESMARVLAQRETDDVLARAAGLVVNTMGWTDGLGYDLLLHAISALSIDIVAVIDHDKLTAQLKAHVGSQGGDVQVVKLPKSGGVVTRDTNFRKRARDRMIRSYFYGSRSELNPCASAIDASSFKVFRVGGGARAPNTALPLGATSRMDPLRVAPLPMTRDLERCVLGVLHGDNAALGDADVLSKPCAGIVCVTEVDASRGKVHILQPSPGSLPSKLLLSGTMRWND